MTSGTKEDRRDRCGAGRALPGCRCGAPAAVRAAAPERGRAPRGAGARGRRPHRHADGGRALTAWETTGLRTAVHVAGTRNDPRATDRGWSVEIAWPWQGLRELTPRPVPPRDGDQWRINFSRVQWEHEVA